jgi:DUF1365 family protein
MTGASGSALYVGTVMHCRWRPVRHRLRYRVFSLFVDIDELPALQARLRLFSFNRANLFSLHDRDYGPGDGTPLREMVERQLQAQGLQPGGRILLLTMPRILGYVFNPLSVYFCHRLDGTLQATLYEVNNTFGERHSYLIEVEPASAMSARIEQRCAKRFHVSPFLGMEMDYAFTVTPPRDRSDVLEIGMQVDDALGRLLTARLDARRRPLDDAQLLRAFATCPLLTLKVVAAIHWEALRLWFKGVPVHPHPGARRG